jgi:hypothetical protein
MGCDMPRQFDIRENSLKTSTSERMSLFCGHSKVENPRAAFDSACGPHALTRFLPYCPTSQKPCRMPLLRSSVSSRRKRNSIQIKWAARSTPLLFPPRLCVIPPPTTTPNRCHPEPAPAQAGVARHLFSSSAPCNPRVLPASPTHPALSESYATASQNGIVLAKPPP